jgi:hypothetical protein
VTGIDESLVLDAVHDSAVRRVQYAYADVVNRRAFPELTRLFRPDAPVVLDLRTGEPLRLVGGTEVGEFIAGAVERFEFFEFVVLNAHIVFPGGPAGGEARSRLFMCELRQEAASGRWTTVYGLYHDRFAFEDGRWWIAERRYHSLARDGRDRDAFPFPTRPGIDIPGL